MPKSNKSAVREFSERKNWPDIIVKGLEDFICILSTSGDIKWISPSTRWFSGSIETLEGHSFGNLVHPDDVNSVKQHLLDSRYSNGTKFVIHYRLRNEFIVKDGSGHEYPVIRDGYSIMEATGCAFESDIFVGDDTILVILNSKPYETLSAAELDSFIHLRFENELLRQNISSQDLQTSQITSSKIFKLASIPSFEYSEFSAEPFEGHVMQFLNDSNQLQKTGPDDIHKGVYDNKKQKVAAAAPSLVCTDCGTSNSPEWRKGPMGAKTLCNACGLRWSKRERALSKFNIVNN